MKIIKSKYKADDLTKYYEYVQSLVDGRVVKWIYFLYLAFTIGLRCLSPILIAIGMITKRPVLLVLAAAAAVLSILAYKNQLVLINTLMNFFILLGKQPTNYLTGTMYTQYHHNIKCCEKILQLTGTGTMKVLKKGDIQVILHTDSDGKEELISLACPVKEPQENTLDFSCYDEILDKLINVNLKTRKKRPAMNIG